MFWMSVVMALCTLEISGRGPAMTTAAVQLSRLSKDFQGEEVIFSLRIGAPKRRLSSAIQMFRCFHDGVATSNFEALCGPKYRQTYRKYMDISGGRAC